MERISQTEYYLNIAKAVAARGTCLRRNYGAVIVNNDRIVATGYTGAPSGRANCCDLGKCVRNELNIPRGERYELCRSVHAEMNAVINASKEEMMGATMYLIGLEKETGELVDNPCCCSMCKRILINSGISKVIACDKKELHTYSVIDWIVNDDSLNGKTGY